MASQGIVTPLSNDAEQSESVALCHRRSFEDNKEGSGPLPNADYWPNVLRLPEGSDHASLSKWHEIVLEALDSVKSADDCTNSKFWGQDNLDWILEARATCVVVENQNEFDSSISRIQQICLKGSPLFFDLEGNNASSYLGHTCLIQLLVPRHGMWLVDVLKVWNRLSQLSVLFTDPRILKVGHGCQNDLLDLQRDFGIFVVNLFDTQVAAQLAGMTHTSLDVLYKATMSGGVLDSGNSSENFNGGSLTEKDNSFTNQDSKGQASLGALNTSIQISRESKEAMASYDWRRRPLEAHAVMYAQDDVLCLPIVAKAIVKLLTASSTMMTLVMKETASLCARRYAHSFQTQWRNNVNFKKAAKGRIWLGLIGEQQISKGPSPIHISVLDAMYAKRETLAASLDISPSCLLSRSNLFHAIECVCLQHVHHVSERTIKQEVSNHAGTTLSSNLNNVSASLCISNDAIKELGTKIAGAAAVELLEAGMNAKIAFQQHTKVEEKSVEIINTGSPTASQESSVQTPIFEPYIKCSACGEPVILCSRVLRLDKCDDMVFIPSSELEMGSFEEETDITAVAVKPATGQDDRRLLHKDVTIFLRWHDVRSKGSSAGRSNQEIHPHVSNGSAGSAVCICGVVIGSVFLKPPLRQQSEPVIGIDSDKPNVKVSSKTDLREDQGHLSVHIDSAAGDQQLYIVLNGSQLRVAKIASDTIKTVKLNGDTVRSFACTVAKVGFLYGIRKRVKTAERVIKVLRKLPIHELPKDIVWKVVSPPISLSKLLSNSGGRSPALSPVTSPRLSSRVSPILAAAAKTVIGASRSKQPSSPQRNTPLYNSSDLASAMPTGSSHRHGVHRRDSEDRPKSLNIYTLTAKGVTHCGGWQSHADGNDILIGYVVSPEHIGVRCWTCLVPDVKNFAWIPQRLELASMGVAQGKREDIVSFEYISRRWASALKVPVPAASFALPSWWILPTELATVEKIGDSHSLCTINLHSDLVDKLGKSTPMLSEVRRVAPAYRPPDSDDLVSIGEWAVTTNYRDAIYIASQIDTSQGPYSPFPNPKFSCFEEYLRESYQINLLDHSQPLVKAAVAIPSIQARPFFSSHASARGGASSSEPRNEKAVSNSNRKEAPSRGERCDVLLLPEQCEVLSYCPPVWPKLLVPAVSSLSAAIWVWSCGKSQSSLWSSSDSSQRVLCSEDKVLESHFQCANDSLRRGVNRSLDRILIDDEPDHTSSTQQQDPVSKTSTYAACVTSVLSGVGLRSSFLCKPWYYFDALCSPQACGVLQRNCAFERLEFLGDAVLELSCFVHGIAANALELSSSHASPPQVRNRSKITISSTDSKRALPTDSNQHISVISAENDGSATHLESKAAVASSANIRMAATQLLSNKFLDCAAKDRHFHSVFVTPPGSIVGAKQLSDLFEAVLGAVFCADGASTAICAAHAMLRPRQATLHSSGNLFGPIQAIESKEDCDGGRQSGVSLGHPKSCVSAVTILAKRCQQYFSSVAALCTQVRVTTYESAAAGVDKDLLDLRRRLAGAFGLSAPGIPLELLQLALVHPSVDSQYNQGLLASVGSAVSKLVVTSQVLSLFPASPPGDLHNKKVNVLNHTRLCSIARQHGLHTMVKLAAGVQWDDELMDGFGIKTTPVTETLHAVIGLAWLCLCQVAPFPFVSLGVPAVELQNSVLLKFLDARL